MKKLLLAVISAALVGGQVCRAADVAWQEEFDTATALEAGRVFYTARNGARDGDNLIIHEARDGVLRFGIRYDPAVTADELNLVFGDPLWWPATDPDWGPFDLTTYPFVEIRWRSNGEGFVFNYAVEAADGSRRAAYTWPQPDETETDAQGRQWNITRLRVAPDSAAPTPATAVKLLGFNLVVRCFPAQSRPTLTEDVVTELDYIRIRGFTDEEAAREKNVVAAFTGFPRERWRGFDTFFPFGVYGTGYLRSDFEYWGGDYEGAYGLFARYRFNLVAANDEVELGRYGGQTGEPGLNQYIEEMQRHVRWAADMGIKLTADVRRMMDTRDPYDGYEPLLPLTRRLAVAFPDDSVVVGWKLADEPGADRILNYGMMIRALLEADPLKRPDLIVFNNVGAYMTYAPYSQLGYWDHYPGHDPWAVRETARTYRAAAAGKPVWAVLQAFESRPPANGVYERTSDAETRMMAYLALAEGAKGLIWFNGWSASGRDEGMITRTGRPQGGWMTTLCDLSRLLVPIGRRLLPTTAAELARRRSFKKGDVRVRSYEFAASAAAERTLRIEMNDYAVPLTLTRPVDGKVLEVSVLRHTTRPHLFLVFVNEDLENSRRADVTLPDAFAATGLGVYDLHRIDGRDLLADNTFHVDTLAGGDGRIYLVADAATYAELAAAIRCDRAREDVRVLQPDLTVARRWGLPLAAVDAAVAACRAAADRAAADDAAALAVEARRALEQALAQDSEFHVCRRLLEEVACELDEVVRIAEMDTQEPEWWTGRNHPMMVPNPNYLALSEPYWLVGRRFRDLTTRFLHGDRPGLTADVLALRRDCLAMRDGLLAMLRTRLKTPAAAPAAEEQ